MTYKSQKHNRKSIRLQEYDYSLSGWYYVTICANNRKNIFGRITNGKMIFNPAGIIVKEEWTKSKEIRKNIDLDYYVIMPNHLHGIIIIEQSIDGRGELNSPKDNNTRRMQYASTDDKFKSPSQTLGAIVRGFKSSVTKRLRELNEDLKLNVWQRNYYEHIIRNDYDLHRIRTYIRNNPIRWYVDEYYNA